MEKNLKTENIKPIKITGIKIRTINSDEMNQESAKIPGLWEKFYGDVLNKRVHGSPAYGVYSNYESDANGKYDLLAGVKVDFAAEVPDQTESIEIFEGRYLVFEAEGPIPQTVYETWGKVWEYFSSESAQYTRAYKTDFEVYRSQNEAAIYIGII